MKTLSHMTLDYSIFFLFKKQLRGLLNSLVKHISPIHLIWLSLEEFKI